MDTLPSIATITAVFFATVPEVTAALVTGPEASAALALLEDQDPSQVLLDVLDAIETGDDAQ